MVRVSLFSLSENVTFFRVCLRIKSAFLGRALVRIFEFGLFRNKEYTSNDLGDHQCIIIATKSQGPKKVTVKFSEHGKSCRRHSL